MSVINIDDEENADWLHKSQKVFEIQVSGKKVGTAYLDKQKITSADEELKEYFYLLIDEGIGQGPITENDGTAFVQAMKQEGYTAV